MAERSGQLNKGAISEGCLEGFAYRPSLEIYDINDGIKIAYGGSYSEHT